MNSKGAIVGTIITVLIGGTAYTFNQTDVAKNFAQDTGLSQEQAEQYVSKVTEDELAPFDQIGASFTDEGEKLQGIASEVDCANYEYEWESATLTCQKARLQLNGLANDYVLLGKSYVKLSSDSASEVDTSETIRLIDQVNSDLQFEVVTVVLDKATIDELRNTNSYNRAILKTALESK